MLVFTCHAHCVFLLFIAAGTVTDQKFSGTVGGLQVHEEPSPDSCSLDQVFVGLFHYPAGSFLTLQVSFVDVIRSAQL